MSTDDPPPPAAPHPLERPALAYWMWARGLTNRDAEGPLRVSYETVRRICLPFDHADRVRPSEEVLGRIVAWTRGEVTGEDFIPLRLRAAAAPVASEAPGGMPAWARAH